jgi:hypothetical protein
MPTTYTRKPYQQRKAQTPQQQLDAAIARANEKGLKVAFAGADFWAVPSDSESLKGLYHIVTRSADGKRLCCECLYSQNKPNGVCVHRAVVYLHLKAQAEAARPKAQPAQQPAPTAPAKAQPTEAERRAAAARRETAPLVRDNGDFSIFAPEPERPRYQSVAARANADRAGDAEGYVPADYRSHEYR